MKAKFGFTLPEILVVIVILSIVGALTLTIFSRTLQGTNKSQIIGVIKQNGQAVLEKMDKTIRNASSVVCVNSNPQTIVIIDSGGLYTRYRFFPPRAVNDARNDCMGALDPLTNPTNGCILQDNPVVPSSPPLGTDPNLFIRDFIATICTTPLVTPTGLTDTNSLNGVSVENLTFTRDKPAGFKDQITINFNLAPAVSASQSQDAVNFKTTINLR